MGLTSALLIVVPLWLLLMAALLCVTTSGGFDWLPMGRPALFVFTVAAAFALAAVSLMSIGMYTRPGFTPRGLYVPVIYLVPVSTALLLVLSLNPKLVPGLSMQWLLTAALHSRDPNNGLSFLSSATLSSAEQRALASPARKAIERVTSDIPAPNYMTSDRRKQLLRWGRQTLPVIIEKFSGTDVDFSRIVPEFEYALRPDDTRR